MYEESVDPPEATRPPVPDLVSGRSGWWDLTGSLRSFSSSFLVDLCRSSLNMGSAWGVMICWDTTTSRTCAGEKGRWSWSSHSREWWRLADPESSLNGIQAVPGIIMALLAGWNIITEASSTGSTPSAQIQGDEHTPCRGSTGKQGNFCKILYLLLLGSFACNEHGSVVRLLSVVVDANGSVAAAQHQLVQPGMPHHLHGGGGGERGETLLS